ncbi:MAG TPA: type II CRISPR-associated endonuclease Cas1 [Methylocystis sp.]|nr:type II CRISPR-associated endonuclease Cas1 [Methylocystis sp.]
MHLSRSARLNVADNQIVVAQDDGEARVPLEDVAYVVLDAPHATLTSTLLSACMEAGVVIVSVDARHTPNGVALPFHSHHRQAGVAAAQVALGEPFKKRCWQRIVVAKIENQAAHLEHAGGDAKALRAMAKIVGSGDPDNVEARAAREYWRTLFQRFTRDDGGDLRNKMMNYGYAVVRAGVARALVANGLLPAFGLHHASVTNAFNLADDLLEPFRPFVDAIAAARAKDREKTDDLTLEDRRALAGVLLSNARVGKEAVSLLVASEKGAESLVQAMEASSAALLRLPAFAPTKDRPP